MVEYTSITFKTDFKTKESYAICFYWDNGERKFHQKHIPYNFFYADPDIKWDPGKFKTLKGFKNVNGTKINKIIPKDVIPYDDKKKLQETFKGKIYESDVKPLDRFLWEEKPKFTKKIRKWYFDIETMRNEEGQYSEPSQAENKVSSITFYDNFNKIYFHLLKQIHNKSY
jgi:hypothetical protein